MSSLRIALCLGLLFGISLPALAGAQVKRVGFEQKSDEELLRWLRYITLLETKTLEDPGDYNLFLRLADAYGRLGPEQREKVLYYTTQATLAGADDARVDIILGDFYFRAGDLTAAIRAYLRVLDRAPAHGYTLVQLRAAVLESNPAVVDIDLGQIRKRLEEAGLYLPQNPPKNPNAEDARPLIEEGYGFITEGEYDQALERFKAALDLDPYSGVAVRGMGIVYAQTKKIRQALAAYMAYLDLSPNAEDADAVRDVIEIFFENVGK